MKGAGTLQPISFAANEILRRRQDLSLGNPSDTIALTSHKMKSVARRAIMPPPSNLGHFRAHSENFEIASKEIGCPDQRRVQDLRLELTPDSALPVAACGFFRQVARETAKRQLSERGPARVLPFCRGSHDLRKKPRDPARRNRVFTQSVGRTQ